MLIYLAVRTECSGPLCEILGAALDEAGAVAMCSQSQDAVIELQAGRHYPAGEDLPPGVRVRWPLCEAESGWQSGPSAAVPAATDSAFSRLSSVLLAAWSLLHIGSRLPVGA